MYHLPYYYCNFCKFNFQTNKQLTRKKTGVIEETETRNHIFLNTEARLQLRKHEREITKTLHVIILNVIN